MEMDLMAQHGHPCVGSLEADPVQLYSPYGKACLNCVKSKTRCVNSTIGGKCERCHRLNKDCQPAPTVRKRRVSKRPTTSTSTKTATLEEKLDGIVQMLQRSQASMSGISQSHDQIQNQTCDSTAFTYQTLSSSGISGGTNEFSQSDGNLRCSIDYGDIYATNSLSSTSDQRLDAVTQQNELTSCSKVGREGLLPGSVNGPPTPATSNRGNSTVPERLNAATDYPLESKAELEEYLETYRTKMVPYLPVVCISENMTMEELRKERPFLCLVIRMICNKNLDRQEALVLQVKKVLGMEMLIEGTKSLDLFLGVLVFIGWCHIFICNKPIISTLIQLGLSLAYDLGLTRPLPGEPVHIMLNYTAQGCPKPTSGIKHARTMEERRAVLGLYLISSVSANYFQRIELMRWTPYFDECLRLLEEKKDCPTDELLVSLVRVQLICNKGISSTWNDTFGDSEMGIPADFHVQTLKSQLDSLERSIPPELKSNMILRLHILNTTLSIHEHSLGTTPKCTSSDPASQLQRIKSLWICLTAVKSWFNIFFSLESFPLSCYTHFSMAILTQMGHCLVVLYRLSTFETPDITWDRQRVRDEMDLGDVVKLIVDRWEQVPAAVGIEMSSQSVEDKGDGYWSVGPWMNAMRRILQVGSLWEAKVTAMTAADSEREDGTAPEENRAVNGFGVPRPQQMDPLEIGAMNLDMLDDAWIRDMLRGGYDFNSEPYF